MWVEPAQRLHEGMDGAAILEVSDHIHCQSVESALGLLDRIEVEQGLGRMLVGSVAGVDDRHRCHGGGDVGGSLWPEQPD